VACSRPDLVVGSSVVVKIAAMVYNKLVSSLGSSLVSVGDGIVVVVAGLSKTFSSSAYNENA